MLVLCCVLTGCDDQGVDDPSTCAHGAAGCGMAPPVGGGRTDGGLVTRDRLGAACDDDAGCPEGAFCLTPRDPSWLGGAPPQGLCVADCSSGAGRCDAFEDAVCVDASAGAGELTGDDEAADAGADRDADAGDVGPATTVTALCLERCTLGTTRAAKCHGLSGIACELLPNGPASAGYCRPLCTIDQDCPTGHCELLTGTCTEQDGGASTRNLGQSCAEGAVDTCGALCVSIDDAPPVCSHRCVFGSPEDCAPADAPGRDAACVLTTLGGGIGDVGYCAALCDCPEDCGSPTQVCDPFQDDVLESTLGRAGTCTAAALAVHEPLVCSSR
jgi:hypothetical protein